MVRLAQSCAAPAAAFGHRTPAGPLVIPWRTSGSRSTGETGTLASDHPFFGSSDACVGRVAGGVNRCRRRGTTQGISGPEAPGGDHHSDWIEQHREHIRRELADQPDLTIAKLRRALARRGFHVGFGALHRVLVWHRTTRTKKTGHAIDQDRPDEPQRSQAWASARSQLDLACIAFRLTIARATFRCAAASVDLSPIGPAADKSMSARMRRPRCPRRSRAPRNRNLDLL